MTDPVDDFDRICRMVLVGMWTAVVIFIGFTFINGEAINAVLGIGIPAAAWSIAYAYGGR